MQAAVEGRTKKSANHKKLRASAVVPARQSHLDPLFTPGNTVQCMSAKCPCGNWVFIGIAGHLRRASDVRSWDNLKCPTCTDGFSADYESLELVAVPFLIFELGYCTPETL
jgi:hypothetical protein